MMTVQSVLSILCACVAHIHHVFPFIIFQSLMFQSRNQVYPWFSLLMNMLFSLNALYVRFFASSTFSPQTLWPSNKAKRFEVLWIENFRTIFFSVSPFIEFVASKSFDTRTANSNSRVWKGNWFELVIFQIIKSKICTQAWSLQNTYFWYFCG